MKKYLRSLGTVAIVCIFIGAVWLLYHELRKYQFSEIRDSMAQMSALSLWASFGLMIVNYAILVGYDALALKAIHKPLSFGRTALVSFIGCVISYNFGALLGGSSVRYRFYSAWGFSVVDIVRLVLMLAVTFWVGALGLAGAVFIVQPLPIPPALNMPVTDVRPLGAVLVAATLGYLVLSFVMRKPIRLFGKEFAIPTPGIAIMQTLVAGADLIVAAACLFVLMPDDLGLGFIQFLSVYLLAVVAVVLTHVPGGAGVFELVILSLSDTKHPQAVIAALLCFRVIYYLLPLIFAAIMLAWHEAHLRRHEAERVFRDAGRWMVVLTHDLLAYITFAAGFIMLCLEVVPVDAAHLQVVMNLMPLWLLEVTHLLSGVIGVGLMLLARGLQRRQAGAWQAVQWLLLLGIASLMLKGFDWRGALMLAGVFVALFNARRRFYRRSSLLHERYPSRWTAAVLGVVFAVAMVGLFIHGRVIITPELWWTFGPGDDAPRLLRAFSGIGLTLLLFALRRRLVPRRKNGRVC